MDIVLRSVIPVLLSFVYFYLCWVGFRYAGKKWFIDNSGQVKTIWFAVVVIVWLLALHYGGVLIVDLFWPSTAK